MPRFSRSRSPRKPSAAPRPASDSASVREDEPDSLELDPIDTDDLARFIANGGKPYHYARQIGVETGWVYRRIARMRRVVCRFLGVMESQAAATAAERWKPLRVCKAYLELDPEVRAALENSRSQAYRRFMEAHA